MVVGLLLLGALALFAFAAFALYVKTYLPEGGQVLMLSISNTQALDISFASGLADLLTVTFGIGLLAAWRLRKPRFTRYLASAHLVIDQLLKSREIDEGMKETMLQIVTKELTPCSVTTGTIQCEEGLLNACYKLAHLDYG
jgi:hypothetical protein